MRHVMLTCRHHPNLRWMCKSIATSPQGGYNGMRHIFYQGDKSRKDYPEECLCPTSDLILAPEETWDEECES